MRCSPVPPTPPTTVLGECGSIGITEKELRRTLYSKPKLLSGLATRQDGFPCTAERIGLREHVLKPKSEEYPEQRQSMRLTNAAKQSNVPQGAHDAIECVEEANHGALNWIGAGVKAIRVVSDVLPHCLNGVFQNRAVGRVSESLATGPSSIDLGPGPDN